MVEYSSNKNKISFREIVLSHVRKILEISSQEFRGGFTEEKIEGTQIVHTYIPDSRKQYIQSIESLSDTLIPYFDEGIQTDFKALNIELGKLKKKYNDLQDKGEDNLEERYSIDKLQIMRKLFRSLNLLLKRLDYLKGAKYDEPDDD